MELSQEVFAKLQSFYEPDLRKLILKNGSLLQAKEGDLLIREGQYLNFLPIVIEGKIRVYQEKDDREILLYYVEQGQTCMMSLSSVYFDYYSAANGIAVQPSNILVLPANIVSEWQLRFPSWNTFIISTFKSRYDELLSSFKSVAFQPVNVRLKDYLLSYVENHDSRKIPLSHQTLANELGTTRVVISRILKQFEVEKKVSLNRGFVYVKDKLLF
ncbi:MAG: hypothetical protein CMO01_24270 [Thalassobius sp.]|nr:hypothetical protein [Thalassovita sp.]